MPHSARRGTGALLGYLVSLTVLTVCAAPPPAQAGGWQLVFSDEFDAATLDRQVWATRYVYDNDLGDTFPNNGERQRYRDRDNHILREGHVDLIARKTGSDEQYPYESGMLRSYQTFYYGYIEARVKTPRAKGTWPAFWLAADRDGDGNIQHPPEIDIFDNANNGKDATASMVWSGGVGGDKKGGVQGGQLIWADKGVQRGDYQFYQSGQDLTAGWHVYGLLWTPGEIALWLDGKPIYRRKYKWISNDGALAGPAHVLFNLAVGGPWAGRHGIDDKAFPQTFSIDYVRVCQISDNPGAGKTCAGSKLTPDPAKYAYRSPIPGDLKRPILFAAELDKSVLHPGETARITHKLTAVVSTKRSHKLYQYVVDAQGQTLTRGITSPSIPTTEWAGRTVRVTLPLEIPAHAAPGKYRVFVAVGSPVEWDPEGKTHLQALTLQYDASVKQRERIGQPVRYKVAELVVLR